MTSCRESINNTILFLAVLFMPAMVDAQVSSRDTAGYLPEYFDNALDFNLMLAASKGLNTEVERLILRGADVNSETQEGATPLVIAAAAIRPGAVEALLTYNADPNKITNAYETPLIIILKKLVDLESSAPNPIITSKEDDCLRIAESLIRYGADVDFQDNHGVTALNYASAYGSLRFADLLLYYMADIDKKDFTGTTPLMSAIWAGYANVADLLIQNGANLEARDNEGFTPFLIAAQNGDTLLLHLLLDEGVDIYETCGDGWDALNLSIRYNHKNAVSLLLKAGNKWSDSGNRPLNHFNVAARYGRKDIYELLQKNNFTDTYKTKISQFEILLSTKFNPKDVYTGASFIFREPRKKIGIITGFDTKLWYTKVMVKMSDDLYYQYMDKSSLAYAGIFKDIQLTDRPFRSNYVFSGSLAAGYSFGNKFKGTESAPENRFIVLPGINIKWVKKNFSLNAGLEYMNSGFYKIWPVWMRAGISYNFDLEFGRPPVKTIRWY